MRGDVNRERKIKLYDTRKKQVKKKERADDTGEFPYKKRRQHGT